MGKKKGEMTNWDSWKQTFKSTENTLSLMMMMGGGMERGIEWDTTRTTIDDILPQRHNSIF